MPTTSLFFLPAPASTSTPTTPPPLQTLVTRLTTVYTPNPLPNWSLSHRLFRSTPSTPTTSHPSKPPGLRYLHILTLSHRPENTSILITSPQTPAPPGSVSGAGTPASSSDNATAASTSTASIITIPSGAPTEEFIALLSSKLNPLWQPRHSIQVSNGQGFEVGEFQIRVGEVRQGMGGTVQGRGVVAEVEYVGAEEEEEGEGMIRTFWEGLGWRGAREVGEEGWGDVRRWCEVLRLRG